MEHLTRFNGVLVLLTTGKSLSEVQNFQGMAHVVISVYADEVVILQNTLPLDPLAVTGGEAIE